MKIRGGSGVLLRIHPLVKRRFRRSCAQKLAPLRAALNAPNEEQAVISDVQRREIMTRLTQAQAEHGEEKAAQEGLS